MATDPIWDRLLQNAIAERASQNIGVPSQSPEEAYNTAVGMGTEHGDQSSMGIEFDLRTLTPNQLIAKYGEDRAFSLMNDRIQGSNQYQADLRRSAARTPGEALWDTGTGIVSGFGGSLGGLGALGVGLINDDAGNWLSDKVAKGMNWVEQHQSDGVNAARRIQRAKTFLDARDSVLEQQSDIAKGKDEFVSKLSRFGRDVVDTISNSVEDPTMVIQGSAEAAGSLLAGGPVTKSLRVIGGAALKFAGAARIANVAGAEGIATAGNLARAADAADAFNPALIGARNTQRLMAAGDWAAWPASTAALEGSGTYLQTVQDIQNTSYEDLEKSSPTYRELVSQGMSPEDARSHIANKAGLMAAAIQAPSAAALGTLTRFAEHPLHVPSVSSAISNALLKEPTEEFFQSGIGQLAQNVGQREYADPNQDLLADVGAQAGQGALYGLTSAGAVQAPGVVAKGAVGLPVLAYKAVKRAGGSLANKVSNNYNVARAQLEKASPVSEEKIQTASEEARPQIVQMVPALQEVISNSTADDAQKARESAFVSSLGQAWDVAPEELAGLPDNVAQQLATAPNRFVALHFINKWILGSEKGSPQQLQAIALREKLSEPIRNLQTPDLQIIGNVDGDLGKMLTFVRNVLSNGTRTPGDSRVERTIDETVDSDEGAIKPEQISDAVINTPEGQQAAQVAAALATARPGSGSREVNDLLLKHATEGKINLTDNQKAVIQATQALFNAEEALNKGKAEGDLKPADIVHRQILTDRQDPLTQSKNPRFKQSAKQHLAGIYNMIRSGNIPEATALLEDFGLFVQHMQNKVDAHNRFFKLGNPFGKKISFTALDPDSTDRVWYQSKPSVFVNTTSADSIRHAQTVALEAKTLHKIYEGFQKAFPNLETTKVDAVSLDPGLQGDPQAIIDAERQGTKKPEPKPTSRITPEQAQKLSDQDLNDQLNSEKDPATLSVLNSEMEERETKAAETLQQEEEANGKETNSQEVQPQGTPEGEAERVDQGTEEKPQEGGPRAELTQKKQNNVENFSQSKTRRSERQEEIEQAAIDTYNRIGDAVHQVKQAKKDVEKAERLSTPELIQLIDSFQGKTLDEVKQLSAYLSLSVFQQKAIDLILSSKDKLNAAQKQLDDLIQETPESNPEKQGETRKIKNGEVSLVESSTGPVQTIKAYLDDQQVGELNYSLDDSLDPEVKVEDEFQRRGVASAMYDLAKQRRDGRSLPKAARQSEEGKLFREGLEQKKVSNNPVEQMYPGLAAKGEHSLYGAMVPNTQNSSRLASEENPVRALLQALSSQEALINFIGHDVRGFLSDVVTKAYALVLSAGSRKNMTNIGGVLRILTDNLHQFYEKNDNRKKLADGVEMNRWQYGKALNIINEDGEYNPRLIQAAALAGIQWALAFRQKLGTNDSDAYAQITGVIDASLLSDDIKMRIDRGVSEDTAKTAIAQKIREYWGLRPNNQADMAYAEGISEGVAAEVMTALEEAGFLLADKIQLTEADGLPPLLDENGNQLLDKNGKPRQNISTPIRYSVIQQSYPEGIDAFPDAIDQAVLPNAEPLRFIDEVPPVAQTQMNNPSVPNTDSQTRTLRIANKTEHRVSLPMAHAYMALGVEGLIALFSGTKPHWTHPFPKHLEAIKSREQVVRSSYEEMRATINQMINYGENTKKSLKDMVLHFAYNMSKVGRMQMLGAFNSQSSKTMREVILPTWSTLDLDSNQGHLDNFMLAIAQHLDQVKVAKISKQASIQAALNDLNGKFAPLVQYLREWVSDTNFDSIPDENKSLDAAKIQELLAGESMSQAAFHSLVEYARFLEATPQQRQNFTTPLYLEADGVTNGPIMAMMMLTHGAFKANWINNIAKGGISFGINKTMADLSQNPLYKNDLYKTATVEMTKFRELLLEKMSKQKDSHFLLKNMGALSVVMDTLFGKDVTYDPATGSIVFERGIAKNPLTITIYGSSAIGIAGNFANQALDKIYELKTEITSRRAEDPSLTPADILFDGDQQKYKLFEEAYNLLTGTNDKPAQVLALNKMDGKYHVFDSSYDGPEADFLNLRDNFLHGLVDPMVAGIRSTVGNELTQSVRLLRQATQVQSIFLEQAFREEIQKVLDKKAKGDETRRRSEFLSRKELEEIELRLKRRFPSIETKAQIFRINKTQRSFDENVEYSHGLDGKHRTKANVFAPADAGVSGIASLVIGFGDGYMVQVALQNPAVKDVLAVFDGINMPLDQLSTQGEAINKAAYQAFMNNPMAPVSQAYSTFLKLNFPKKEDYLNLPEQMLDALAHAFQEEGGVRMDLEQMQFLLKGEMESLETHLKNTSLSIEARHRALQETGISVDHMASTASPFHNGVEGEYFMDELLAHLNERYAFHLNELKEEKTSKVEPTNVVVHTPDQISALISSVGVSRDQAATLQRVLKGLVANDISIVTGSMQDIINYRLNNGLSVDNITENDHGFFALDEGKIYLMDVTSETLTHEIVHAATVQVLMSYYKGEKVSPEVEGAIKRLETMMQDFMGQQLDLSQTTATIAAEFDAKQAIQEYLDLVNSNPVLSQAGALNEFMAWTLSNNALMRKLKKTPTERIVEWTKEVLKTIKAMFWSGERMMKPVDHMLSNIRFNTAIIARSMPTLSQTYEQISLFHSTTPRPILQDVRAMFKRILLDQLGRQAPVDRPFYESKHKQYLIEVEELAKKAARAFHLDNIEESTLVSVVAALGTEMTFDTNVLNRIQTLFAHFQKNLTIEDLHTKNAVDRQADDHWANEKFNLLLGKTNRLIDPNGRTSLLPTFIGLALVSKEFRDVLTRTKVPKGEKLEGGLDNSLRQFGTNMMENLASRLSGDKNSTNVREAMDALVDRLYQHVQNEQTTIDVTEGLIDKGSLGLNGKLRDGLIQLSDKGMEVGKEMKDKAKNPMQKSIGNIIQLVSGMASEKNGDKVAEGVLETAERLNLNNGLLHLLKDFIERTSNTGNVYDLIKPISAMVQQLRQQFRDSVPKIISESFKKVPTKEQYASMFRAMGKTDLAVLINSMGKKNVLRLFIDQAHLDQRIDDLEQKLQGLDRKNFSTLNRKMQQLANYMNTGIPGSNLLRNAYAVANLFGEGLTNRPQASDEMIDTIDQLISLYALEGLHQNDRDAMASLVQEEPNGTHFVLSYLEGQRNTEIRKARQRNAYQNHFKGYMHSLPQKTGHVMIAEDSDFASLRERGYVRMGDYKGSNLETSGPSRGYYYTNQPARAIFMQGMMQNVDQTAYGVDPSTGYSHDLTAGRVIGKREVARLAASMNRETNLIENLLPVYNKKGKVIAFERSLDPRQLDRLEKSEQLNEMLGVWRGRQVEERISQQMNRVLIDNLHDNWMKDRHSTPELYVNLLDPDVLDAVQRDAVSLFSDESLQYIQQKFGRGTFMVRKSYLDDVTGYRSPSVSDFWTNINRFEKSTNDAIRTTLVALMGPKAYERLVVAERYIQGFMRDMRSTIVVKSMVVFASNAVSNIYQLIGRGVNPIQIARETPGVVSQLHNYMTTRLEQIKLEAELRAVGSDKQKEARLRARIRSITDSHQRLEIWPLIQAGEFSTISDVGVSPDDTDLTSGRISEWIENKLNKLPPGLQTAARYGLITKDTALYQGLQKGVLFGDFVAKQILFNHLMKKENYTREQALAVITQEFVNYDRLPGRTRGGLENMGLLWFYNYKLRITKVALSMLRNNPLHSMISMALPNPVSIGIPLTDNVVTKALQGNLGWSIGPGMGLRAPLMNPLVNLVY